MVNLPSVIVNSPVLLFPRTAQLDGLGCPAERDDLQSVLQYAMWGSVKGLMVCNTVVDLLQLVHGPEHELVSVQLYPQWLKVNVLVEE